MKLFNKIAIIGVGLIGGSVGLAIKKKRAAGEVVGVFRRESTLKKALRRKAVDSGTLNLKIGVADADLIILASPVHLIPRLAKEATRYAKRGTLITDVGSTKQWIVSEVDKAVKGSRGIRFVGSHPMAGSEQTGVEFAREDLLDGSPCIVTRTPRTNPKALKGIVKFWASLGAKVKVMSPKEHDRSVAFISHLPHLAAYSLAGAVPERDLAYAAEGFKDTTRVASSDPALWADIFLTNKKELIKASKAFEGYYKKVIKVLSKGDRPGMMKALQTAKAKRDKCAYGKVA